ncbi:MAG: pyrimidine operon attenuation protein/uracil phosphoribosyltransferase [Crocinitomicaceae bacterium]|jgi:pyrimidine operon attenuation protein/uracil phosphoribosyltransferase
MQEILSHVQIEQKINRLAHQLLENCFEEKEIFIGGIQGNGYILAERLSNIINANSDLKTNLFELKLNKSEPWSKEITLSMDQKRMENGYIVLVDDVLNSGKTMQYALVEILQFPTKAIKTLTLVDRKHRRFPIKANFVGMSLSTTLKQHVEVDLKSKKNKAYLV